MKFYFRNFIRRLAPIPAEHRWNFINLYLDIDPADAKQVILKVNGELITYDTKEQKLSVLGHSAPIKPIRSSLRVQVLADRTSIEVLCNGGEIALSSCFLARQGSIGAYELSAKGGKAIVNLMKVQEVASIWK